ncbi:ABC transporter ATP-binding protein [Bradyrhizobium sp. dw_411]|uniref:ABC transporter ATP-binding protein n=1 Tax=Bradyrhizobium sp. dw_411 TaxID=2720082 RepID=UPI001BCE519F|nr:ABC transporter ATP-binding protein [Bradyrhizobium sp. dw_411]
MKHVRGLLDGEARPDDGRILDPLGSIFVHNISKIYESRRGAVAALAPVTFDVASGDLVAIVGQSGCGKSTLLRMIAGLVNPSAGTIRIGTQKYKGAPPSVRYVFQDYASSLFPWKTVDENLQFGIRHSAPGAQIEDVDAECRRLRTLIALPDIGQRYPWELSGGMQQRVAIARALAAQPKIILLDEAFSSVDALSRSKLQDMTRTLWRQLGTTILFVTHDVEEAVYLANRILVLGPRGGGIIADIASNLPMARTQIETRESLEFLAMRRELINLIQA